MSESCPRCGTRRVGYFRFCRSCQFDFDDPATVGPGAPTPTQPTQSSSPPSQAVGESLLASSKPSTTVAPRPTWLPVVAIAAVIVFGVGALLGSSVGSWLAATPSSSEMAAPGTAPHVSSSELRMSSRPGDVSSDPWDRDSALAIFEGLGYWGGEAPLTDGTPRWLAINDKGGIAEVVGAPRVREVSLAVVASTDTASDMGSFVASWLPAAAEWLSETMDSYDGTDLNDEETYADRSIGVQTITVGDSVLVTLTIWKS
jgi:hypothetical protein